MDYLKGSNTRIYRLLDAERKAAENAISSSYPAVEWIDGHPIGNGDLGIMSLGSPEEFQFYLGKSNIWDDRTVAGNGSIYTPEPNSELIAIAKRGDGVEFNRINANSMVDYSSTNYPSPQSCGILSVKFSNPDYRKFTRILELDSGRDIVAWNTNTGTYKLSSWVHQDRNITEINITYEDS
ncbi:MAG: hypothetical protein HN368_24245, partial [Spirochaetales bacterium]|nr:hypothetical protein [Spirochaetales bacterium]